MSVCRQQKHTQHVPSTKTECDYLCGWIIKQSHKSKIVKPRDLAGNAEEEEEEEEYVLI